MYVSGNLQYLMQEKGVTGNNLAKAMGWKPAVISSYRRGGADPPLKNAKKLAEFFNVTLDDFVNTDLRKSSYEIKSKVTMLEDSGTDDDKDILIRSLMDRVRNLERQLESEDGKEALDRAIIESEEKRISRMK